MTVRFCLLTMIRDKSWTLCTLLSSVSFPLLLIITVFFSVPHPTSDPPLKTNQPASKATSVNLLRFIALSLHLSSVSLRLSKVRGGFSLLCCLAEGRRQHLYCYHYTIISKLGSLITPVSLSRCFKDKVKADAVVGTRSCKLFLLYERIHESVGLILAPEVFNP